MWVQGSVGSNSFYGPASPEAALTLPRAQDPMSALSTLFMPVYEIRHCFFYSSICSTQCIKHMFQNWFLFLMFSERFLCHSKSTIWFIYWKKFRNFLGTCNNLPIRSMRIFMKKMDCYSSISYFSGVYLHLFSISVSCWYFPWNSHSRNKQRQLMKGLRKKSYICKHFNLWKNNIAFDLNVIHYSFCTK